MARPLLIRNVSQCSIFTYNKRTLGSWIAHLSPGFLERTLWEFKHFCQIILNLDQWFRRKFHLQTFLIYSSGSPFVHPSETICAILIDSIMRNICEIILNLDYWFWRRCHLKVFLYLNLAVILFYGVEPLCNFGSRHYGKHSSEII